MSKNSPQTKKGLNGQEIQIQMNYFLGDILTIMDACFQDIEQRKAIKDLIKQAFWRKSNHLCELAGEPLESPVDNAEAWAAPGRTT